ncbi:MAG: transcriptional repressor [Deltaproteobacteria bacterium]|nr:transcriptional repressor [Deltaproteobacteria bacterium]MBW2016271.1 transcriptional repressor [Deltaproteobacteria bacterium]MBW2128553.1 transcriptional repressor [Deltaproteobacteria bacterium]MBW2303323.1 transcriptional repressor [Deltaproteobacteria bacterium]
MGEEVELFRSFIGEKGLRNTPEREMIIEEIFASREHFDVDELYLRLRKKGSKVSKASIYRNLPLILECGLIKEVWHQDGHMHYEPLYGREHHCHLRCIRCGRVIEFYEEELKNIEKRLEERYRFQIIDHRMDVLGYCPECRKKQ